MTGVTSKRSATSDGYTAKPDVFDSPGKRSDLRRANRCNDRRVIAEEIYEMANRDCICHPRA